MRDHPILAAQKMNDEVRPICMFKYEGTPHFQ